MQNSLRKFEKKIQGLVENNSDHLFSSNQNLSKSYSKVKEAFLSIDQFDQHGKLLAPLSISLMVDEASPFLSNQDLVDHLSFSVQELAELFDFASESPIKLKFIGTESLKNNDAIVDLIFDDEAVQIAAKISSEKKGINPIPEGAFFIVNGKEIFPLNRKIINIGRLRANHLVIDDPQVSRRHGQIRALENAFQFIDLNSSGGSELNGEEISRAILLPGDVLKLAGSPLIYGQDSALEHMETQEIDLGDQKIRSSLGDPTIPNK